MRRPLLMIAVVGMLAGCISGKPPQDTVTDKSGNTTVDSERSRAMREFLQ